MGISKSKFDNEKIKSKKSLQKFCNICNGLSAFKKCWFDVRKNNFLTYQFVFYKKDKLLMLFEDNVYRAKKRDNSFIFNSNFMLKVYAEGIRIYEKKKSSISVNSNTTYWETISKKCEEMDVFKLSLKKIPKIKKRFSLKKDIIRDLEHISLSKDVRETLINRVNHYNGEMYHFVFKYGIMFVFDNNKYILISKEFVNWERFDFLYYIGPVNIIIRKDDFIYDFSYNDVKKLNMIKKLSRKEKSD